MAYTKTSHFEDMEFTKQDLKDLKEAFKSEKFRSLLNEYIEEVTDPNNIALYQKEVTEFEKDRGVDVTFINPEPGYVMKSSCNGEKKAFLNICSNGYVGEPSFSYETENGSPGSNCSIPYLQGQPRDELDKKNEFCVVYDIVFHPYTLYLADNVKRIRNLVNDIALTAVEDSFNVKLDRKNITFPKSKYKGSKIATVVRKMRANYTSKPEEKDDKLDEIMANCPYQYPPPYENNSKVTKPKSKHDIDGSDNPYTTPRYVIKHRKEVDLQEYTNSRDAKSHSAIPSHIIVEIDLPLIKSAQAVNLDVVERSLALISEKPSKYKLNVSLPYAVDDENGNAKFDKSNKKLIVTLPVKRNKKVPDFVREDSGIESDVNQYNCSSSSEEDIRKNVELLSVNDDNDDVKENISTSFTRTSEEVKTIFLNPEFHYCFPENAIQIDETFVFIKIIIKNIDPQSIAHQFLFDGEGVHVKLSSLGSGFFPIHHSLCLRIPGISFDKSSLNIEVWDNYLDAKIKMINNLNQEVIGKYYIGPTPESMEKKSINTPAKLCQNLEKREGYKRNGKSSLFSSNSIRNKLSNGSFKNRTSSESCELPELSVCRSILKGSRSLSESHTDEYNAWSSIDSGSHEDLGASKKSVRFSDVVSKKIFRANSSILGQRKKNEKKSRNRKKAAHERNKHSVGSEESETDRDECDSVSELSELSDLSSDDSNDKLPTVSTTVPPSKKHRKRGAKNQRKAASTAKYAYNHFND